jgi:hypothetical protein
MPRVWLSAPVWFYTYNRHELPSRVVLRSQPLSISRPTWQSCRLPLRVWDGIRKEEKKRRSRKKDYEPS